MRTLKLGMSADLSPNGSIHTQTFLRAVNYIEHWLKKNSMFQVDLLLVSDNASASGATEAAKYLLEQKVDAIVGHFASEAAMAAMEVYESQLIPVLLPAATAVALTQKYKNCFRVCPADDQQLIWIQQFLILHRLFCVKWLSVTYQQSQAMKLQWQKEASSELKLVMNLPDCGILIGRYHYVVEYLNRSTKTYPVMLTDDAFHSHLGQDVNTISRPIWVCGFEDHLEQTETNSVRAWYQDHYQGQPNTYFFETIAAVQHIVYCFQMIKESDLSWLTCIGETVSQTVLGKLHFQQQENPAAHFCIWRATPTGFKKQQIEVNP